MFKFLFYIWGLLAIWYEYWSIYNFEEIIKFRAKAKSKEPNKEFTSYEAIFVLMQLLYFFWVCVGLFSSQWFCFLGLMGLSTINMILNNKNKDWHIIYAGLSILIILFAILNTYHFHINPF